jgi:hypothetical protein
MIVALVAFLSVCAGQVLKVVRNQPNPLKLHSISQCCEFAHEPLDLIKCSNSTTSMTRETASVSIVTYLSSEKGSLFDIPDIIQFGAYMVANTAAYAEQNGYSFKWLSEATGKQCYSIFL